MAFCLIPRRRGCQASAARPIQPRLGPVQSRLLLRDRRQRRHRRQWLAACDSGVRRRIGYDGGVAKQSPVARVTFWIGFVVFVLGNLMLCYCPWMFVISGVFFAVAAVN